MEFSISRRAITNIVWIALINGLALVGYYTWSSGILDPWFQPHQTPSLEYGNEPALKSLAALYSPAGERSEWGKAVCDGMTAKGCELFNSMYASVIWSSSVLNSEATVSFVAIANQLQDGSQVWKTEIKSGDTVLPVYILVSQNETKNWLLERVLFTQETDKYKNQ